MPTTVTSKIGATNSPVTMDYTTLQSWEDACPANLVTDDKIWRGEVYNQGELSSAAIPSLSISGMTVDSTRYVELTTATGASFKDHADKLTNALKYDTTKGACCKNTNGYSQVIVVGVDYTRISNLQLKSTATPSGGIGASGARNNLLFQDLLVEYVSSTGIATYGAASKVINCLSIRTGNTTGSSAGIFLGGGSNAYGCTVLRYSDASSTAGYAFSSTYGTATIKNCAGFGYGSFYTVGTSGAATGSNNASDQTISFGTSNQASLTYTSQFEGTTSSAPDFRAKSTGSLDLNGTPDSTNTPNDIVGQTRHATTPTIGCWEVVAATSDTHPNVLTIPISILCM